jgi:PAS domain S-box-containing protein
MNQLGIEKGGVPRQNQPGKVRPAGGRSEGVRTSSPIRLSEQLRHSGSGTRIDRRTTLLRRVESLLSAGLTREDAGRKVVQAVAEAMDWDAGMVWSLDPSETMLRLLAAWTGPFCPAPGFEELNRRRTFTPGLGFPGRVWSQGTSGWEILSAEGPDTQRMERSIRLGLREAVGIPLRSGSRILGVMEFFLRSSFSANAEDLELLEEVATLFSPSLGAPEFGAFEDPFFAWSLELACVAGPDGYFKQVNPAWEKVLGLKASSLLSSPFLDFVHPDDRERTIAESRKLFSGSPTVTFENRYRAGDGSYHWLSWTCPAPRIGDELIFALARDITEQKRIEDEQVQMNERLLQGQKLQGLGQLAAGVAHEINNPVGFILSNLHTLREYFDELCEVLAQAREAAERPAPGEDAEARREAFQNSWKERQVDLTLEDFKNALDETRQGTERIRDIVRSLKEFSHADESELKPADLNRCLDDALKICWNELKYKADVRKEYGELPPVVCFPQRLGQVFLNLLVNAAQAMTEHGEILLRTAREGEWVVVRIRDTGSGISQENLKKIFEPFFTTKPVGKGTGLGLHVVYKVIQAHLGKVEVQSELGKGTEFIIRLPIDGPGGGKHA